MNMTVKAWLVAGTFVGASALGVFAHAGATGIVKERMDDMTSMAQSVKSISDMFRAGAYDAAIIITGAQNMQAHAGQRLIGLFPEGSNSAASKAKDAIWSDWHAFSALANELSLLSIALDGVASQPATENSSADNGMGTSSSDMGMGASVNVTDPAALAQMSAEQVFGLATKTCSTCHTQFRVEK